MKLKHLWRGHPDEMVELGPPDSHGFHVAYCRGCYRRFVEYDMLISHSFLERMRESGTDEDLVARLERANDAYVDKRARYYQP